MMALVEILDAIDRDLTKAMDKRREARRPRIKRGATLRPSEGTPLWNAQVSLAGPRLGRRGARAPLSRELGVPDAERTLRLLVWLSRQPLQKPDALF